MSIKLNHFAMILHATPEQERKSYASPAQLLLTADARGFWQDRVLLCDPTPHVEVQADHPDQTVQPMEPVHRIIER